MSTAGRLTVCVSTFLRDSCLYSCVESIRSLHPTVGVVVADDGYHSVEKTEWLKARGVNYIPLPFDSGLAIKRNVMVDAAATAYVVMMDDDMILTPATDLTKMISLMEIADLASGKLIYPAKGRERSYLAEMLIRPPELVCRPLRTRIQQHQSVNYRRTDLSLNCFLAKTEMLRSIRWDNRFKITYEHTDFFLRMKLAGVPVVYTGDVIFTEKRIRSAEYRKFRLRKGEHQKIFFEKWGFSRINRHPSVK